jgi:PD-(D/E)XK nuclease superfamily protein
MVDHVFMVELPTPIRPLSTHPVDVGHRSEAMILAALVARGFQVWLPWSTNHRYDFLLEVDACYLKIQCKTGRLRNGAVEFNAHSIRSNMKQVFRRSYVGEIDYFATYCPDTDGVYMVRCEAATPGQVTLRIEPTANGQHSGVRWAAQHELARWVP